MYQNKVRVMKHCHYLRRRDNENELSFNVGSGRLAAVHPRRQPTKSYQNGLPPFCFTGRRFGLATPAPYEIFRHSKPFADGAGLSEVPSYFVWKTAYNGRDCEILQEE